MRKLFFTFLLLISAAAVSAQVKTTVSGTVVAEDKQEGKIGVVGATLELMDLQDTLQKKYTISAIRGAYQFKFIQLVSIVLLPSRWVISRLHRR